MKTLTYTAMAVLAMAASANAEIKPSEVSRLTKAAEVLRETRTTIPQEYWSKARCVAVIPDLKKAAFIVGGEFGKGVMSCRAGETWSAPVFLELAKGSWGFQAGAEEVDVVMLVMNESGVQKLMKNKVALGADASIAAGPVGRQGQIATDATLSAEILAYSRAKGLFAGINLSGGVVRPDEDANADVYGPGATPSTVLASRSISAPPEATSFMQALGAAAVAGKPAAANSTPEHEVPPQATAAVQANRQAAAVATGTPAGTVPSNTNADLRAAVMAMQESLDRMIADQNSTVGTSGQSSNSGQMITVSRERLEALRTQLNALLAAINDR
jgi:SH3 domain-containing YSC84-like protein 1